MAMARVAVNEDESAGSVPERRKVQKGVRNFALLPSFFSSCFHLSYIFSCRSSLYFNSHHLFVLPILLYELSDVSVSTLPLLCRPAQNNNV